ncbi:MAG: phosphate acyltransferase PlsX [Cellvibrionaceae bacterium]
MGGDFGPHPVICAAQKIISLHSHVEIFIVGHQDQLSPLLESSNLSKSNQIHIVHASDIVSMDDKPSTVLRQKQNSSMWKALELVKTKQVDACVSCGNTGALMAVGRYLLKAFPGIDRPAICKAIPSRKGHCYLLDLGANINCTAEQLAQFASMGSVLASVSDNNLSPSVGLLNIGEENIKGVEQVRLASDMLSENKMINYAGFVEGDAIYTGTVDVIVCDGFVGNIALKVSEGAATFLLESIQNRFQSSFFGRLSGWFASPVLSQWREKYNPNRHNGACFLGLQGTVIKSHGSANTQGFYHALEMAIDHVNKNMPEKINQQLEEIFT